MMSQLKNLSGAKGSIRQCNVLSNKYVLFRFVNIICQLQKNQSAIWKIVKEVRHINQYESDELYYCNKTIFRNNIIQAHRHASLLAPYVASSCISSLLILNFLTILLEPRLKFGL